MSPQRVVYYDSNKVSTNKSPCPYWKLEMRYDSYLKFYYISLTVKPEKWKITT